MLVLIDNYDSFTYNLVQYFGELGADIRVYRNDQISLNELIASSPTTRHLPRSRRTAQRRRRLT